MSDVLAAETPAEREFFESGGQKALEQGPNEDRQQPGNDGTAGQRAEGGQREQVQQQADDKPKPGFVPHQALHEERRARQELQRELAEIRARLKAQEEERARANQPSVPDLADDPVGHFAMKTDMTAKELAEVREKLTKQEQERQQAEQRERFQLTVASHEREFAKQTPDYMEAMEFIRAKRDSDLQIYGVVDPAERLKIIQNEAMGMAWNAIQSSENPAKRAYELAKNWGFKPKSQKADEKIETLQKGAEAAKSLSGKGAASPGQISPEDLLEMSDEEFDKHWDKTMRGGKK
jgi:hypothetical protein